MAKFQFSVQLRKELRDNGKSWDDLLFRACMEARQKEVKASVFAETLRKSGFRCGTGPARAAYKAVREGGDLKAMVKAINTVKAKRKTKKTNTANTDATDATANTADNTDANTDANTANTANTDATAATDTLIDAIENALRAAITGKLEVTETWLIKANAMMATIKELTAQAKKTA